MASVEEYKTAGCGVSGFTIWILLLLLLLQWGLFIGELGGWLQLLQGNSCPDA